MADVFDIDIGGEDVQNGAHSDDEDEQDNFQRWVWMRFVSRENVILLLARQMTITERTPGMCRV